MLKGENLVKFYGKKLAVNGLNIEVEEGEIVGLLGPNGAGKTTTFYILVGLIKPNSGRVLLDDEDISSLPMYQRARLGISYLPQETSIFRRMTVRDNILSILQMQNLPKDEEKKRLGELLDELDIAHLASQKANTLSGGEKRRVEITRALVNKPRFLLLDEPFTGIDPIVVADLKKIILKLKEKGIGVLITDHNVRDVLSITDRSYIIYEGQVLISGTREFLQNDQKAREVFLGYDFE